MPPSMVPTGVPTGAPTGKPTEVPTAVPTAIPTYVPTSNPTTPPTHRPTPVPTPTPTMTPTISDLRVIEPHGDVILGPPHSHSWDVPTVWVVGQHHNITCGVLRMERDRVDSTRIELS